MFEIPIFRDKSDQTTCLPRRYPPPGQSPAIAQFIVSSVSCLSLRMITFLLYSRVGQPQFTSGPHNSLRTRLRAALGVYIYRRCRDELESRHLEAIRYAKSKVE